METAKPAKKKKPVRAYTMQKLQEIVANPDKHPERLVELCRREIKIREQSRKYRKEVETYSDDRIEEILAIPGANPAPLVYRCQVERRRRAKSVAVPTAGESRTSGAACVSEGDTSAQESPVQKMRSGLLFIAICGVITLIPAVGPIIGLILLIMGYVYIIKGISAINQALANGAQPQEALATLRQWCIATLVAGLFPVAGTIAAIITLVKYNKTLSGR